MKKYSHLYSRIAIFAGLVILLVALAAPFSNTSASADDSQSYQYTAGDNSSIFYVPDGVTSISAFLVGASGAGSAHDGNGANASGGGDGIAVCTLTVSPGDALHIHVGTDGSVNTGGLNGGGNSFNGSGGGGGATDIRWNGDALSNRIMVAGGGGGGGAGNDPLSSGGDGGNAT